MLEAEEPNLLHARGLARRHGWLQAVISAMQGLWSLYAHTGRPVEWAKLVDEVKSDFVNPANDGPLPGREEQWGVVNQYRVLIAEEARQWGEAERLQQAAVRWAREQAAEALALPAEALDGARRNRIRTLEVSLEWMGRIQRERESADCLTSYREAAEMAKRAGNQVGEATVAFNLGLAYMLLPAVRDLAEAERWSRRSLEMWGEEQRHYRAKCLSQLGFVAHERFQEARAAKRPKKELLEHLNAALLSYQKALALLPSDAVNDLAGIHHALGNIYGDAGDLERALPHYQDSIRYWEKQGDLYAAAKARLSVAVGLAKAGRLADARAYALATLRNFETYGDRAASEIQKTRQLLAGIDRLLTSTKAP